MPRILAAFLLAACSSPAAKPDPVAPAAEREPIAGCTCAQLTAPVREPSTHERVRWERTAAEVEVVIGEVARAMTLPCPATVDADVSQIFTAHAAALADFAALKNATCEGFARWADQRDDDKGPEVALTQVKLVEAMRSGKCELSKPASDQLNALLIIQTCTTVSESFTGSRAGARRDHDGEHLRAITEERTGQCALSATTANAQPRGGS